MNEKKQSFPRRRLTPTVPSPTFSFLPSTAQCKHLTPLSSTSDHLSSTMAWVPVLSFFLLSSTLGITLAASPWTGPRMEDCDLKICGQTNVTYPFWLPGQQRSYCGFPSFGLTCDNNVPTIQISGQDYYVQSIFYQNQSMLVASTEYVDGSCPVAHLNVSLDPTSFNFSSANKALLFSYCPEPPPNQYRVPCASTNISVYLGGSIMPRNINSSNSCDTVVAPVLAYPGANSSDYATLLKNGFLLDWTVTDCTQCATSGGRCGYENTTQQFICICADGAHSTSCSKSFVLDSYGSFTITMKQRYPACA